MMSFLSKLKKEVIMYLEELKNYNDTDHAKSWEIVNEASRKEIEFYESTVEPTKKEEEELSDKLSKLNEFANIAVSIEDTQSSDDRKRELYGKLVKVREEIKNFFPDGIKRKKGKSDLVIIEKLLTKRLDELRSRDFGNYHLLAGYMNEEEITYARSLARDLSKLSFSGGHFPGKDYPNLTQVLMLATRRSDVAGCCPQIDDSQSSIVFREEFSKLRSKLINSEFDDMFLRVVVFTNLSDNYTLDYCNKAFTAFTSDKQRNLGFVILNEKFLNDLLQIIDEKTSFDLFDLADYIRTTYGCTMIFEDETTQDMIEELTRLYRETPEQILVTEQRYYQEKQLEQMRENARLERQTMERNAQMQLEESRRQAQMQLEESRRQAEQLEKAERERARREEDREKREIEATRQLCVRCAHYGFGCRGGVPACGNFRAK